MNSQDSKNYAEIVVNIPLDKKFHYSIPENLKGRVNVGKTVKVPFGNRRLTGYCVGFAEQADVDGVKDILSVIDDEPSIDEGMLKVTKWMSEYYCCGWGEALAAILPGSVKKGIKAKHVKTVKLAKDENVVMTEIESMGKRSPAQVKVLASLIDAGGDVVAGVLLERCGTTQATLIKLEKRGLIVSELVKVEIGDEFKRLSPKDKIKDAPRPVLNEEQQYAFDSIKRSLVKQKFNVILLQGVTGSGKTEVYLQSIETAISLGLCSIVLVPEISLTPQTIRYFSARFSDISIMHSNLLESDRKKQWQRIKNGEVNVVVGTRSAIFAPVKNIGLIVVDEEHENTFKQENTPRYHARDTGIMRAMFSEATVVLGSATPSLESYYNAMTGKYDHIYLKKKVMDAAPTVVKIVNMGDEIRETKRYIYLSRLLEKYMKVAFENEEQVLLFLNRRGFAPYISCRRCGYVLKCKSCDITLTYHKADNYISCHYCNKGGTPPEACPECAMPNIKYQGFGTERIEEEIKLKFPEKRVIRMDSDTMKQRGSHEKAFNSFLKGDADILLGTQMIAKGLDFRNVSLVGVISADTSLNIPDFRSSERTFQLLAQVSGRTGRGSKSGKVVIQSFNTTHYSIQSAINADYKEFAATELEFRKELNYPPYGRLTRLIFQGGDEKGVRDRAFAVTSRLKYCAEERWKYIEVLGPAPAAISKIRDKFRWHTILKTSKKRMFSGLLNFVQPELKTTSKVQIIIDVDPGSML